MFEDDWQRLGLAPTAELTAIKKAYAQRLRHTRPDDDAEAYQALREAYERAQQWARWQAAEAVDEGEAVAAPAAAEVAIQRPAEAMAPEAPPEPAVLPTMQPSELIDTLELAWRRAGDGALATAWVEVRLRLNEQPLSAQAPTSAAFANWVLKLPQLPDGFVAELVEHFNWLGDYRTERLIGSGLTQALQEALLKRMPEPPASAELLSRAAPMLGLQALMASGRFVRAQLLATLLAPVLRRLAAELGAGRLRQAGVALAPGQMQIDSLLMNAALLRGGLAALGFVAAALAWGLSGVAAFEALFKWGVASLMLLTVAMGVTAGIDRALKYPERDKGYRARLSRWRLRPRAPQLGLVLLAAASAWGAWAPLVSLSGTTPVVAVFSAWAHWGLLCLLFMAGVLLAWPLNEWHGCTLVSLAPLVVLIALEATGIDLPASPPLGAALAWLLLGGLVHERRLRLPVPATWLLRPVTNSLAVTDAWGYRTAVFPALVVLGAFIVTDLRPRPSHWFAWWVVSLLLVDWAQSHLARWADAALRRAA